MKIEMTSKLQKRDIEKLEIQQQQELRILEKKLRNEQVCCLFLFNYCSLFMTTICFETINLYTLLSEFIISLRIEVLKNVCFHFIFNDAIQCDLMIFKCSDIIFFYHFRDFYWFNFCIFALNSILHYYCCFNQEKAYRDFKESLKEDQKSLKKEVCSLVIIIPFNVFYKTKKHLPIPPFWDCLIYILISNRFEPKGLFG